MFNNHQRFHFIFLFCVNVFDRKKKVHQKVSSVKIMLMRFIGFDNLKWKNEKGVKVSKKSTTYINKLF